MRKNAVKRKLKKGEFMFGTMIKETLNIGMVDILEIAGFDYMVIDMEHARYDMVTIADILQYARKSDITGIVRVPELNYAYVAKALDMGAEGIWVPHVDTEDEARQIVAYGKYPPQGRRGAAIPTFRLKDYQQAESPSAYYQMCNEEVLLIAQIESSKAIANVEKIAAVAGIDICMLGTNDLSLEMGYPGQGGHPEVKKAVQQVVAACKKSNIASGNHIASIDMLRYWMEQGMRMITYAYPPTMIIDRGKEALKLLKKGFVD
jgi:2-keto-3-deoxy-L-rhamnonate aldolase RhmA